MGQFEKIWTWKDIAMDITERLWSTNCTPELNERLQGKVQNIFMFAQSLDPKKTAGNAIKCQANFSAHSLFFLQNDLHNERKSKIKYIQQCPNWYFVTRKGNVKTIVNEITKQNNLKWKVSLELRSTIKVKLK